MTSAETTTDQIAARLRLAREQAGLSQGQVAKMLGLHRPSVSELEAGRRKVSAEELAKLSDIYGVSVNWIASAESSVDGLKEIKLEIAARELAKLKPDDLDRLLRLITALRVEENPD